ncbi:MAG TPA: DUF1634 domain-containing protein [Vicinamibacteria bacterium]|nr:DUF1634 domain-containing protein [Vicinamibacteria bacterium]
MAQRERWWRPGRAEQAIGTLLRTGVLAAGLVVVAAGGLYLARHGSDRPELRAFHGEPQDLRSLGGIVGDAAALRARALIQLGLLLLIATPVARVALSVVVFALEGDRVYVAVTLAVLGLLLYSLLASG